MVVQFCKVLIAFVLVISIYSFILPVNDGNNPSASFSSTPHPIFVSVTEINHNPQDKNLEIACKIFTDDFETVLAKATGAKIDLFNPKDTALTGRQISQYVSRHLALVVDGKPVSLSFVGFERETEAVWSYFEVKNISAAPKNIAIMNNLLYENFKQQINLLHVTVNGKRKSTKLDNPEAEAKFEF